MPNSERTKRRAKGDWWDRSLTIVSGCNWRKENGEEERPEECRFCYADPMCERFPAVHGYDVVEDQYHGGHEGDPLRFSVVRTHPERLSWLKPTSKALTWLCSIAGDLFHPEVPKDFIMAALVHLGETWDERRESGKDQQRVAILTKRYERAIEMAVISAVVNGWPSSQILMFSAGTQASVDRAFEAAAKLPRGCRWGIHGEPQLENIIIPDGAKPAWWVCGGETNKRNRRAARPMHPDWVRGIRDQCQASGTPFWFKSWGSWRPLHRDEPLSAITPYDSPGQIASPAMRCIGKARAGRLLDGRTWDEYPEEWEVR